MGKVPLSSFWSGASCDIQQDMLGSLRDLDLRSNFIVDLTVLKNILFDSSRPGEHENTIIYV